MSIIIIIIAYLIRYWQEFSKPPTKNALLPAATSEEDAKSRGWTRPFLCLYKSVHYLLWFHHKF